MFTGGDNNREEVYAEDIGIIDSYYEFNCHEDEMRVTWEARDGVFTELGLTELLPGEYVAATPPSVELSWDDCGLKEFYMPTIDCNSPEWIDEEIGSVI